MSSTGSSRASSVPVKVMVDRLTGSVAMRVSRSEARLIAENAARNSAPNARSRPSTARRRGGGAQARDCHVQIGAKLSGAHRKMATPTPAAAAPRKKPKATFMLHDPKDLSSLGKYQSTDFRYAALKVASRGHKQILLRKTNTKEIREFKGDVVSLDTPKEIHRGDRVIRYTKKPTVKFLRKFVYTGNIVDDTPAE
jgi:hypothetical protein